MNMKTTLTEVMLYLEPIDEAKYLNPEPGFENIMGNHVLFLQDGFRGDDLKNINLVIIGVNEDRAGIDNSGCSEAPDIVRSKLYNFFYHEKSVKIADAGNIRAGFNINDTYFALSETVAYFLKIKIIPLIIGGTQDLTYALYNAYEKLGKVFNLVSVDQSFDIFTSDNSLNSRSYLSEILSNQPNFLFNFANIGYQSYMIDPTSVKVMENLYFDIHRLGVIRSKIEETEPILRNADLVSVDINSVRYSDAPGNPFTGPNGFYGEEICQITRYAGLSDRLSCIGFFEYNPALDSRDQTAGLIAQMAWYFIEGLGFRQNEIKFTDTVNFIRYIVPIENHRENIVFIKSKLTDRWWIEAPVSETKKDKYNRFYHIPCSYSDYEQACNNEIPDRWWKAYQKLL